MSKKISSLPELEYRKDDTMIETSCFKWRFLIAFFGFFAMTISYSMRSHLSVTIVAMVNTTGQNTTTECENNNDTSSQDGEFYWDQQLQGLVNGGFYWGYLLPQILAGRLAEMYSAKVVVLIGGTIGTIGTLLGPIAARTHVGFFIATRVICGFGLAVFQPCLHSMIAKWSPPSERSLFSSLVYSGNQFGVVISMPIAGMLCEYVSWIWPFYIFGILGAVWLVLWAIFVYNSPSDHRWISNGEKYYILNSLSMSEEKKKPPKIPWRDIARTKAVWALALTHFGYNWGFYTLLTQLPSYMSTVLCFDIGKNGILSSLPYVVMMIVGYTSSYLADLVIKRGLVRTVVIRKSFNTVALYGSAISLLIITFLNSQTTGIYTMLILAVAFYGGTYAGFQINHVDLSPTFAGTLQGITNTCACIPGIVSPYLTGVITEGNETQESWSVVFYISMSILIVMGTVFLIFGTSDLQSWNNVEKNLNESQTKMTGSEVFIIDNMIINE